MSKKNILNLLNVILIFIPLIGAAIITYYNDTNQATTAVEIAGYVWWVSLITAILSLISIFNVKKRDKIIPVAGVFIGFAVAILARTTYWLGGITW